MAEEAAAPPPLPRYTIGYALPPKKVDSFIQPSLLHLARQRGIDLVPIDLTKPLTHQGPFDCLLHKLYTPQWNQQLLHYSSNNPTVPIIDPPDAIRRLHDRVSMLQVVTQLEFQSSSCSVGIPHQLSVQHSSLQKESLEFPVIVKPLVADGTATSHQMSLVFNQQGLGELELEAPFVVQEFVNHGGVVFKVYVVGHYVQCVKRRSLPDIDIRITDKLLGPSHNFLTFSQISNLTASASAASPSDNITGISSKSDHHDQIEAAQMPPVSFLTDLANALRNALSLNLFNFDVIRDSRAPNRYLVIDINYFPGYAKMPSYETVLTDFFLDILHPKH